MTTKFELAEYLVNLHTLMDAQSRTGVNVSTVISDEYNRVWAELKSTITKDAPDEARTSNDIDHRIDETGTDLARGESGRRI